jgi:hypothetical protein
MSAVITSVEHSLATAASDTVKVARFVETSVLPVLKTAQANASTIEAVTGLVSPQAANIERAGFAVHGLVMRRVLVPIARFSYFGQFQACFMGSGAAVKVSVAR